MHIAIVILEEMPIDVVCFHATSGVGGVVNLITPKARNLGREVENVRRDHNEQSGRHEGLAICRLATEIGFVVEGEMIDGFKLEVSILTMQ